MLSAIFACDDPPTGTSVGTGPRVQATDDAGSSRLPTAAARPDGGPRLPDADAELTLRYRQGSVFHRIEVEADLSALDVHFSIDTTQSIAAEIDALQGDLRVKVVPDLSDRVPDVSFGVSHFEDFPGLSFGFAGDPMGQRPDTPFELLTPVTDDLDAVASAVARLDSPLGSGSDVPEAGAEALWQIATGEGYLLDGATLIEAFDGRARRGGGTVGGVGFRDGALHVVVHVTDAPTHLPDDYGDVFPDTHGLDEAAEALVAIGTRVVGIVSNNCERDTADCPADTLSLAARADLESMALATGAVAPAHDGECPHGIRGAPVPALDDQCPLVFNVAGDGSGLAATVVDAIVELVDGIRFERIHAEADDDPLGFVRGVGPVELEQDDGSDPPTIADLLPADEPDGVDDSFVEVRARARLGFDVELRNDVIAPSDRDQRFRAVVKVLGDGLIVRTETLRLVVPAAANPDGPVPRGGDAATATPDDDAGTPGLASP